MFSLVECEYGGYAIEQLSKTLDLSSGHQLLVIFEEYKKAGFDVNCETILDQNKSKVTRNVRSHFTPSNTFHLIYL